MGEDVEDVGEDDGGVGVDCGDDDGPGGVPAPPGERGREPPFFFFLLDLPPRWEKGFPSWSLASMEAEGREYKKLVPKIV